jgi:dihydroorotate dehydrogenase electron transfer subunit
MATIIVNQKISSRYYRMRILCPPLARRARPGQFVMARVTQLFDPLLRRPLSIHRVCHRSGGSRGGVPPSCIEIIYKVVGRGTQILSRTREGEEMDLLGPLGNGFSIDLRRSPILMVAGGIGIAPLFSLAQVISSGSGHHLSKSSLTIFIGGKTSEDILCVRELRKMGAKVAVSTEDGSTGSKGMVTDLLGSFFKDVLPHETRNAQLYSCGPLPMLRVVSELARLRSIPCQISLESRMACGVGACLGCCVLTTQGNKKDFYQRVCREGPVFDSATMQWNEGGLSQPKSFPLHT